MIGFTIELNNSYVGELDMTKYSYGWKKQSEDARDYVYSAYEGMVLPPVLSLQHKMPPVYDQLACGSCTAQAIAAAMEYDAMKQGLPAFTPSRLFIYYNERLIEGTTDQDSGANIRDGIKSVNAQGVCAEGLWPYDIAKFTNKPDDVCYKDGKQNRSLLYQSLHQTAYSIKHCLANNYPVIFGFTVYESFESNDVTTTGIIPMPQPNEQIIGGHAVLCVGFDDSKSAFLIRNSWGSAWGIDGYFYMPYNYMLRADLASDLWCIQTIS